jgi:hypothetical protein
MHSARSEQTVTSLPKEAAAIERVVIAVENALHGR